MNKHETVFQRSSSHHLTSGSLSQIPQIESNNFEIRENLVNPRSSKGFGKNGSLPSLYKSSSMQQIIKPQIMMAQEDLKDWLVGKAPQPGSVGESVQMFLNQSTKPSLHFNYSAAPMSSSKLFQGLKPESNNKINQMSKNDQVDDGSKDCEVNIQQKQEELQQQTQQQPQKLQNAFSVRRHARVQSEILDNFHHLEREFQPKSSNFSSISSLQNISFDPHLIQQQDQEHTSQESDVFPLNQRKTKAKKVHSTIPFQPLEDPQHTVLNQLLASQQSLKHRPILSTSMVSHSIFKDCQSPIVIPSIAPPLIDPNSTTSFLSSQYMKLPKSSSNSASPQITPANKTISFSRQNILKDLSTLNDSPSRKYLDFQTPFSQHSMQSTEDQSPNEDIQQIRTSQHRHLLLPKIQTRPKNISSFFQQASDNNSNETQQTPIAQPAEEKEEKMSPQIEYYSPQPKQFTMRLSDKMHRSLDLFGKQSDKLSAITNPQMNGFENLSKQMNKSILNTTKSALFSQKYDCSMNSDSPGSQTHLAMKGILKNMNSPFGNKKKQVLFDQNLKIYELSQQQSQTQDKQES